MRTACGPWSSSTMATRASRIFPPKALPRMMSWTKGKIMAVTMSAGERKNLRISRSMMAIMRFMAAPSWPQPSWPQPRTVRHDEAEGLHLLVAKLASRVVDEDIVERSVLHAERLDLHCGAPRQLYQRRGGLRSGGGQQAIHASALVLHAFHAGQRAQPFHPVGGRRGELRLDHIASGHAVLQGHG